MVYSPNWIPQSQRNAQIVDRILNGAHPRDIPIEQPLLYAFSINLKTARALSLTIPQSVMLQATTVIE
jgi:putative ABC transport system substrate-binding protein